MLIKPKRILYLDLMRAFAVLMMVQGHTIDTFLSEDYRTSESIFYSIWYTLRGFTAPIFMFTSATVFTYLLNVNSIKFSDNPRVKKSLIRFVTLLILAYLLRYPTAKFFDFSGVSHNGWLTFFTVDALHLIGFGLLCIIGIYYLSDLLKIDFKIISIIITIIFLLITPFVESVNWIEHVPILFASYLTNDHGSFFPLFPWLVYMTTGAVFGAFLSSNQKIVLNNKFSFVFIAAGLTFLLFGFIEHKVKIDEIINFRSSVLLLYRLGFVFVLSGLISLASINIKSIPNVIKNIGKHTLVIYCLHLMVLYGCVIFPGLYKYWGREFNDLYSILAAIIMVSIVSVSVYLYHDFRIIKRKIATAR